MNLELKNKREENVVFERWKESDSAEDLNELAGLLSKHAIAVTYQVFHERREDVAQEAVVKGLEKIKDFRGDSLFSTWFHAVALNHCRTKLRKEIESRVTVELRDEDAKSSPESWMNSKIELAKVLSQLDAEDQEFVRDKLEGRVEGELAEKYNLSLEGIRSRWFAIRKRIQQIVRE